MSDERSHHVTVRLLRGYEFIAEFDDVPGIPSMVIDEQKPPGGSNAPSAAAMLGAAVGNCLAASLAFCLRQARLDLQGLTASVTTHVVRNDKGHFRVGGIDVELAPDLGACAEGSHAANCGDLFKDFCMVTASVQHGIPVHVSLAAPEGARGKATKV
jgi:uncharacterized OsmC-like protein